MTRLARGSARTDLVRVGLAGTRRDRDAVAVEEPLEIRVQGKPVAVLMRTPGADRTLAAGFLYAERIVWCREDIAAIEPCEDADHSHGGNVWNVTLGARAAADLDRLFAARRHTPVNSSCGLCGRVTIESLQVQAPYVGSPATLGKDALQRVLSGLRERQVLFNETGGLHAAGLFDTDGTCRGVSEDVGRHNAVDKVVGQELLENRLPCASQVLAVSGRASFEIVQKAFLAGVPVVAAVSAPTSLALQLAEAGGLTLVGFARDGGFNVYTHCERIRMD